MNSVLGIHEQSLLLHERRAEVLASNIVNADTPNYKARDLDFKSMLKKESGDVMLSTTETGHMHGFNEASSDELKYRVPMQPSFDGNSVDGQIEKAKYTENSMQYLASLNFMTAKVNNLLLAIKGD